MSVATKSTFSVMVSLMVMLALIATAVVAADVSAEQEDDAGPQEVQDDLRLKPDHHIFVTSEKEEIKLEEQMIRCGVCVHAIKDMWTEGEKVRTMCRNSHGVVDDKCNLGLLQRPAIHDVVKAGCAHLPHSHKAMRLSEDEFKMIEDANPGHTEEIANHIQAVCEKWIHNEHDEEMMAHYLFINLNNRKTADDILYTLQKRFCKTVCSYPDKAKRKPRPHYYHQRMEEQNTDFSDVIELEKRQVAAKDAERARKATEDAAAAAADAYEGGEDPEEVLRRQAEEDFQKAEAEMKSYYDPENTGYAGDL